jgi:hypothetical protein
MRIILVISISLLSLAIARAQTAKGYLVSKNGKQLTGYIGDIYYSTGTSTLLFMNDFGDTYEIEAERIKGFVCKRNQKLEAYKSKEIKGRWYFLKVIIRSENLVLYQAPKEVMYHFSTGGIQTHKSRSTTEFWIEAENEIPMKLSKWGYKNKLQQIFQGRAPNLTAKIGQKGYRYKNLPDIIESYDLELKAQRRSQS